MSDRNLAKIGVIAWREFRHTALTKTFLFGAVILPIGMMGMLLVLPLLFASQFKPLVGEVAVVDSTGSFAGAFDDLVVERRDRDRSGDAEEVIRKLGIDDRGGMLSGGIAAAAKDATIGEVTATDFKPDSDDLVERLKEEARDGRWIAVAVIPEELLDEADATEEQKAPMIDLFLPKETSPRHGDEISDLIRSTTVRVRFSAAGENFERVQTMLDRPTVDVRRLGSEAGKESGDSKLRMLIPFGFMMLLWIATFTAGNFLLTSTIEEKSNKVIEVVLSAVGPLQLLWGKILGLALVSLVILISYGGLAIAGIAALALTELLSITVLLWAVVFFLIAYFTVAALMAAIGSAVNELSEAQTFMAPVMVILITPMLLWMPIGENPNGTLAVVTSMLPPILPFAMVMRIGAATDPVPIWQLLLSTAIGIVSVVGLVWAASRIFRVGILMQGKPPSPLELIRWIRQA